jgi:hypothetical protein
MGQPKTKTPPAHEHGRRRHDERTITVMDEIEHIEKKELTPSEREVLDRDRERWKRIGSGAHLDEWLEFYPGLDIRRRLAMRLAHMNEPKGSAYNQYYGHMLRQMGVDTDDKRLMTTLTAVAWLGDNPERVTILREIREAMTPGQRSRLNSPIAARQRVEAELKARAQKAAAKQAPSSEPSASKEAPAASNEELSAKDRLAAAMQQIGTLIATIETKDREIRELKETIAGTVTLADLKRDPIILARRIVDNAPSSWATQVADSIPYEISRKARQAKAKK